MFGTPCSGFFSFGKVHVYSRPAFPNIFGQRALCNLVNVDGTHMFCGLSCLTLKSAQRDLLVTK